MWSKTIFTPVCWAQSLRRWELARAREMAAQREPSVATASATATTMSPAGECASSNVGPALLVKGPLIVYSRDLARAIISLDKLAADEAHVRAHWAEVVGMHER